MEYGEHDAPGSLCLLFVETDSAGRRTRWETVNYRVKSWMERKIDDLMQQGEILAQAPNCDPDSDFLYTLIRKEGTLYMTTERQYDDLEEAFNCRGKDNAWEPLREMSIDSAIFFMRQYWGWSVQQIRTAIRDLA